MEIWLDGSVFGGAREIYGRMVYFALPGFELRSTDTVVDLGANAGVFTVLAAKLAHKTVAVEAQDGFAEVIRQHARRNGCEGKVGVEVGVVGGNIGRFADPREWLTASHCRSIPSPILIEDIIQRHDLQAIDYLKVDIEGAEFPLFATCDSWISRVNRVVAEVHCDCGQPVALAEFLSSRGFVVHLVDGLGNVVQRIHASSGYLYAKRQLWAQAVQH